MMKRQEYDMYRMGRTIIAVQVARRYGYSAVMRLIG